MYSMYAGNLIFVYEHSPDHMFNLYPHTNVYAYDSGVQDMSRRQENVQECTGMYQNARQSKGIELISKTDSHFIQKRGKDFYAHYSLYG